MNTWEDLNFWRCGEWQVIEERLDDLDKSKTIYCPDRANMFAALDLVDLQKVKVMVIGQDPYPNPAHATGIAFSVPRTCREFPPTLVNILTEYQTDLGLPPPTHGDLTSWAKQGVLLWNAIPTCLAWKSMSHDWDEWKFLTMEIVEVLSKRGIVFVGLGRKAQEFIQPEVKEQEVVNSFVTKKTRPTFRDVIVKDVVTPDNNRIICASHPSPRGARAGNSPFIGSQLFSSINAQLVDISLEPINWRL